MININKTTNSLICPLCHSKNTIIIEKINTNQLISKYNKLLKKNMKQEFKNNKRIYLIQCKNCNLKFFSPVNEGSSQFYEELQKFKWYYQKEKNEYNYVKKYIKKTDKVLEIGSGEGAFAKKITSKTYTGLELNKKAIICAKKENIKILDELIEKHSIKNSNKYDVICSFQVLEHVADISSFIKASISCLKQNGLLIYSIPSEDSFISNIQNNILNMPPHHMSWWSDKTLLKLKELFKLELLDLHHERLDEIHKELYARTITLQAINNILKRKTLLLDKTKTTKLLKLLTYALALFYKKGLTNPNVLPYGHSVTVIYRKI